MKLSFAVDLNMLLSAGVYSEARTQRNSENNPVYTFKDFQGNKWRSSFIVKEVPVLFVVKA